jgi:hypothetical protein
MLIEHRAFTMPLFFRKMLLGSAGHLMFMLSSDLVSQGTVERLKQKPQTQQVIYFFQEAGYGLPLGNESVDLPLVRRELGLFNVELATLLQMPCNPPANFTSAMSRPRMRTSLRCVPQPVRTCCPHGPAEPSFHRA